MIKKDDENLDELLRRFYDDTTAAQVRDDIVAGDELLGSLPGPQPSDALVSQIKTGLESRLQRKNRYAYKVAAVAAAVIVAVFAGLFMQTLEQKEPQPPVAMVTGEDIWESRDVTFEAISADLDQIRETMLAVALDEVDNGNGQMAEAINELETELIEMETVFWKG